MKKLLLVWLLLSSHVFGAKSLYFYSDINNPSGSSTARAIIQASGITYTELVLGKDFRKHNVNLGGIEYVVDVEGSVYQELRPTTSSDLISAFNAAPLSLPTPQAPAINPPVTRQQARDFLRTLLENPPTSASPWTAQQQQQALYLLLLGLFRDLQNGTVY